MVKAKCIFSGKEQEDYKGVYLLKNDGSVNYYSSSKAIKNHLGELNPNASFLIRNEL